MMRNTRRTSQASKRGSALVAVLVIVVIGVLLAAGIMARAVSRVEDSALALRRSSSRAMAWSGVRAAMMGLAAQRETLLNGGDAIFTDSKAWEFADPEGPGIWKVSLLPLDDQGTLAISEAALINVNTASQEQLAKVAGLGSLGAAGVMGRRDRGPILAVEQVQVDMSTASESVTQPATATTSSAESSSSIASGATTHWLTALSADATLAIADGKADRFRASELAAKDLPSEEKASQDERLGAGAGAARVWALRPEPERTLANLVTDLQAANIEANQWGKVLDAVEVSEDLFVLGRIDISRASEGILATLPGVTAEVASNLVRVRSTLDESGRRDLAWPVVSGAVDAKAFAGFVDLITTRSLQYRVRVEAGRTTRSDATGVESDQFGVASSTEASLTDRCVLEAVIDVAGEQPRIAYLRDITLLGSATMVAEAVASTQPESLGATRGLEVIPEGANSEFVAAEPSEGVQGQGDAEPDNGLQTDGLERSGGLDLGGGIDRSATEVNLDSRIEPEVPASSSEPQNSSTETRTSPLTTSGVRADPRLGRWNAGSLGASKGASKGSSPSPSVGDDSGTTAANDGASSVTGRDAAKSTSKSSASAKRVPSKGSNGAGATKKKSPARKEGAQ